MLACYKNKQTNNKPQFITMYLTESEDTANKILVPNLINFMILQQNLFGLTAVSAGPNTPVFHRTTLSTLSRF